MIEPPADIHAELQAWNNGKGISLEAWIGCSGSYMLAVGYATVFWPGFVLFEDYIFRASPPVDVVRSWEERCEGDRGAVERVMNHWHLADIQYYGCPDITRERIVYLGRVLKEIHEAKLRWQFPDRPCEVVLGKPEDPDDLEAYEISFWQKKHAL